MVFDSKKEAARWVALLAEQRAGKIDGLARQRPIRVVLNGQRVFTYWADFVYVRDGKRVVEDVKSPMSRALPIYRLKKKILKILLGIDIVES